jgi:2-oxoisovalerate dehydrogenase E1 component
MHQNYSEIAKSCVNTDLSNNGNEVAFGTIGESSTAEGVFWETINAACVLRVPLAIAIWDDGYGISVPVRQQIVKSSISEALKGFIKDDYSNGCLVYTAKGWDYPSLVNMFEKGVSVCRNRHIPVVFHIREMTQPLGHSTSGSHNRYKSDERLEWEKEYDPINKMREWITKEGIADQKYLDNIEQKARADALNARNYVWKKYKLTINEEKRELTDILNTGYNKFFNNHVTERKDMVGLVKNILYTASHEKEYDYLKTRLNRWLEKFQKKTSDLYDKYLYIENSHSALNINEVRAIYSKNPQELPGREILNRNFDYLFEKYPLMVTFGEDTGYIGDVNQALKGLQEKYGDLRITDTGIREATIIGQGIGLALRGFRPVAEIQYLDYLLYGLQVISDDLATTHYRTSGRQIAPLIIRTRGHRLIGMWHSGSPLGMIINAVRGVYVCAPRNMTQAAGFYNTLMEANDPAIVIEPLRGYNMKEPLPDNTGEFKVPLGMPEVINEGHHITLVTYGWCVNIALEAVTRLKESGIYVELIDIQTLLPFDIHHVIQKSIKKTNNVIFLDEDVPGGTSAYMMQKVLEEQKAFYYLDTPPRTLTAKEHRPAYGADGDYFSKPGVEDIIDTVYDMMNDSEPEKYPSIYS